MYCYKCGQEVDENSRFCPYCGTQLEQPTQHMNYSSEQMNANDAPSGGFAFLSFLFPIVGLILFLIWNNQYPLKARSCLKGLIAGVAFNFITMVCFFLSL